MKNQTVYGNYDLNPSVNTLQLAHEVNYPNKNEKKLLSPHDLKEPEFTLADTFANYCIHQCQPHLSFCS